MIVRIIARVGGRHEMPACHTPAELAAALRRLADEIAAEPHFEPARWPKLARNAEGGWTGHASISTAGADAPPLGARRCVKEAVQ